MSAGDEAPVGVGFLGCGEISGQYLDGCRMFDSLDVRAFADMDAGRARALAERAGSGRACTPQELLADPQIEVVVNLTPPQAHAAASMQIIEAGKHVYSEKPLGLDMGEATALLEAADARSLTIGGAPDTVLGAAVQDARKLIDDGWIGVPRVGIACFASHGYEHFHPRPQYLYGVGGGPMLDMGPYYLTTLVHLLGPMRRVFAAAGRFEDARTVSNEAGERVSFPVEVETHLAGTVEFACGALVTLTVSYEMWRSQAPCIELHGTEGSLEVPNPDFFDGVPQLRRPGRPELYDEQRRDPEGWSPMPSTHRPGLLRGVGVADLVSHLRHGTPHRTSASVVLHVLDAMLAFHASAASGRPIELVTSCERPAALPAALAGQPMSFAAPAPVGGPAVAPGPVG